MGGRARAGPPQLIVQKNEGYTTPIWGLCSHPISNVLIKWDARRTHSLLSPPRPQGPLGHAHPGRPRRDLIAPTWLTN